MVFAVAALLTLISTTGFVVLKKFVDDSAETIEQTVALQRRIELLAERIRKRAEPATTATEPWAVVAQEIDSTLASKAFDDLKIFGNEYPPTVAFKALQSAWSGGIKLKLLGSPAAPRPEEKADNVPPGDALADLAGTATSRQSLAANLDALAMMAGELRSALRDDIAAKWSWMSWLQAACAALALASSALGIYYCRNALVKRLGQVFSRLSANIRPRQLQQPMDEIGKLSLTIESMLAAAFRAGREIDMLRDEIRASVGRRSLELVFDVDRLLNESPLGEVTLLRVLKELEETIGLGASAIYLAEGIDGGWSSSPSITSGPVTLAALHTQAFDELTDDYRVGVYDSTSRSNADEPQLRIRALTVPIREREQVLGLIILEADVDFQFEEWHIHLVEAVSRHIAIAISSANLAHEGRRIALLEERAAIAQELHDSIAQSLSYMKIQISRLENLINLRHPPEEVDLVVQELREGLNGAYRKLRELLTTFRVKVSIHGLGAALQETIEEFEHRSGLTLTLDNRLRDCKLTGNQEIHVLQIIREALSNTVRHAHATSAVVTLIYDPNGEVTVTIDDDGIGLRGQPNPKYHHGMTIMEDRVNSLGGELQIASRAEKGTRVSFRFVPGAVGNRRPLAHKA